MLSQRLMLMLVFSMEPMDMVPVLDMLDLDILVLDTMARGLLMPSLRLKLMLVFSMEDMDMVPVLDMLDLDILVLDMLGMVVMDLAMAVLAMLDLDILVLDMLGMVVMDLDTVLDMDVPSTVK